LEITQDWQLRKIGNRVLGNQAKATVAKWIHAICSSTSDHELTNAGCVLKATQIS
jgi:hypothetical protein